MMSQPLAGHSLSDAQRAAVERAGQDVCVVAGPGSGKTRVLIERFAWLVEKQNTDPARILAITFTEKAATEIKQRLIARFAAQPRRREELERAWISTIHGFCARLLREHAIAAGLAPDFEVLEAGESDHLLRLSAEEALDELYRERPQDLRRLLEALDLSTQDDGRQPDLAESLIGVYQTMRVAGIVELPETPPAPARFAQLREFISRILRDASPGSTENTRAEIARLNEIARELRDRLEEPASLRHFALLEALAKIHLGRIGRSARHAAMSTMKNSLLPEMQSFLLGEWYRGLHELLREAVRRMVRAYAAAKRAGSAVDFADLEFFAVELLEKNPEIRESVRARFHHTLMDELQDTNPLQWRLAGLVRKQFFGVGDLNQSIYGFRHADPELFETYRHSIEAAGGVIDKLEENYRSRPEILAAVSRTLDRAPGIESRPLIAKGSFGPARGPVVERLVAQGDGASEIEAAAVASRIRSLLDSGEREAAEIAVLVRTLNSAEPFERAFLRWNIPFQVSAGRTFLEARETRDLLLLLAALANPLDEIATVGVLRGPLGRMTDAEIWAAGPEGRQAAFEERFGSLRRMAGFRPPDLLLARALDRAGYLATLSERARANVDKFLGWVRRQHRRRPRPLAELLEALQALRFRQSEPEAAPPEAVGVVRILTMHAAKGLEFPVVFVAALHRGADKTPPVVLFSVDLGLGAKWRNPATGKGQSDAVHRAMVEQRKSREEGEENRLLYVAMTRAQECLTISYAERKRKSAWQELVDAGIPDATAISVAPEPAAATNGPLPERAPVQPQTALEVETAQYDASASVTDVAVYAACPRKYYLSRYLGIEPHGEDGARGSGAIELGIEVHRALAGEPVESAEAQELAERFRRSGLFQRAGRATRVEREFDFLLPVGDLILNGIIDLWFEEGGELILVDYKTDREADPSGSHELQLRLYALALEKHAGRVPDRAVLCYLRLNREVEVSLTRSGLRTALEKVEEFRTAQQWARFPLNAGAQCERCPYRGRECPAAGATSAFKLG
jgi:ATP-dependent helicase/nuclease subunit A